MRTSLLLLIAVQLLAACGSFTSKDKSSKSDPQAPSILTLEPKALSLADPNKVVADASAYGKIEAHFTFMKDEAFNLSVTSLDHSYDGCASDPTLTMAWRLDGAADAATWADGTSFATEAGKAYTLTVTLDNSPRCKQVDVGFEVNGSVIPPTSRTSEAGTGPNPSDLTFVHGAVIRELYTSDHDNAAMFVIRPSSLESLDVVEIVGPAFLGQGRAGVLDDNAIGRLFNKVSEPMTAAEKARLVEDYKGATIVYFEGYTGRLCTRTEEQVKVTSKLGETTFVTTFAFTAVPRPQDDCSFAQASMVTVF